MPPAQASDLGLLRLEDVMACDYSKYPKDWKTRIRPAVLERAGHRCEGSPAYPDCRAENYKAHPVTGSYVVLTIGHLDQDPSISDLDRLRAWCQRCHLTYDAKQHAENAARTRRANKPQIDWTDTTGWSHFIANHGNKHGWKGYRLWQQLQKQMEPNPYGNAPRPTSERDLADVLRIDIRTARRFWPTIQSLLESKQ